ncbi:MAG: hypothetical protein LBE08_08010, partial [Bifidobacteriaceae bacterium]|jgi:hypothetical protein|nr:hypothetical protein [Bifidobacteriaceae bacterium]
VVLCLVTALEPCWRVYWTCPNCPNPNLEVAGGGRGTDPQPGGRRGRPGDAPGERIEITWINGKQYTHVGFASEGYTLVEALPGPERFLYNEDGTITHAIRQTDRHLGRDRELEPYGLIAHGPSFTAVAANPR